MTLEPGRVIGDKYVLHEPIGRGGMGSVWRCEHISLGSSYAIKFLRADLALDKDARTRFDREARAAAALSTRHTVQVHDHGVDGDVPYLVMELLEGEDLRARLQRLGRITPAECYQLVSQVARGLHHAHAKNIIHRDLKPANIFIANVDGEEVVKILDFGIAKMLGAPTEGAAATQTGSILGSPHYMSPEQIRGHWSLVDHRTDLWALAVVAFRALTGQRPFLGDVVGDVMIKVCIDPIPPPSSLAPSLPPALDGFFERALARERDARFRSAYELASALGQALGLVEQGETFASWDSHRSRVAENAIATQPTRSLDGGSDDTTLDASGTLTDAGSLQVPSMGASPVKHRRWVVTLVGVSLIAVAGLAVLPSDEPPSFRAPPSLRAAQHAAVTSPERAPTATPTASTTASAAATATAKAGPEPSSRQPPRPPKPARQSSRKKKPRGGFSDTFGYE